MHPHYLLHFVLTTVLFISYICDSWNSEKGNSGRVRTMLLRLVVIDMASQGALLLLSLQSHKPLSYDFFLGSMLRILGALHARVFSSTQPKSSSLCFLPTLGQDLISISFLHLIARILVHAFMPMNMHESYLFWWFIFVSFTFTIAFADYVKGMYQQVNACSHDDHSIYFEIVHIMISMLSLSYLYYPCLAEIYLCSFDNSL